MPIESQLRDGALRKSVRQRIENGQLPSYVPNRIAGAGDLRRYKLLHSPYEPWTAWLLEAGTDEVWPSSCPAFDDAIAIVRAAAAGQGLALARWSLVADEVTTGRLVVAGRAVHSAHAYYFVCPPAHLAIEKVACFGSGWRPLARASLRHRCRGSRNDGGAAGMWLAMSTGLSKMSVHEAARAAQGLSP
jgi:hypothetical protein